MSKIEKKKVKLTNLLIDSMPPSFFNISKPNFNVAILENAIVPSSNRCDILERNR